VSGDDMRGTMTAALQAVTKDWKAAKRRADKQDRVFHRDLEKLRKRKRETSLSIRDAAFYVMERAYNHASDNGRYYANARQIMCAARPLVLELTNGRCWKEDVYFTQTLLKDYLEVYEPQWKVVWDARGHLKEPHTGRSVGLGGLEVMRYRGEWTNGTVRMTAAEDPVFPPLVATVGPSLRYSSTLFIEKEGFDEILTDAGIPERFDCAIMSTKGLPVGAACTLAASLQREGVRVFVVHDFDEAGFKIARTLERGTRGAPGTPVVELGFRLEDVDGLDTEKVAYKRDKDPRPYLRMCGATEAEIAVLVQGRVASYGGAGAWKGERVELNAMTSGQFVAWIERKLAAHGAGKVVPGDTALGEAYRRARYCQDVESKLRELRDEIETEAEIPTGLETAVRTKLASDPALTWDRAVWEVAREVRLA
jgi:hypothetical protein